MTIRMNLNHIDFPDLTSNILIDASTRPRAVFLPTGPLVPRTKVVAGGKRVLNSRVVRANPDRPISG